MKQKYFKIECKNLKVLHLESIRTIFYQISALLYIAFLFLLIMIIIGSLIAKIPLLEGLSIDSFSEFFIASVLLFITFIIPTASLILAFRFPPAPVVTFHSDTQLVKWNSARNYLEIPFTGIDFATSRLLSKSGISTVMVSVFAIDNKPFFEGETPSPDPASRYRKDLCVYKAGGQEDADESIDIIKSFMAGTYDESASKPDALPSKFDNL